MPSFDVVSKADLQEVKNAVDQTQREISTRYDFKGSKATVEFAEKEKEIVLSADSDMHLDSMQEVLKQKLAKRNVSLKSVTFEDPKKAGGDMLRQAVKVKQGLTDEEMKKLNKGIKELKMKVTSQIQGDQLRVTGKKRDDLQDTIAALKKTFPDIELQFVNFRE